jgi:CheY-like chemotaxis protein
VSEDENGPESREFAKLPRDPGDPERERETLPPPPPIPRVPPLEARVERLEEAFGDQREIFARWTRDLFDTDGALARIAVATEQIRGSVDELRTSNAQNLEILQSAFESKLGELREELTEVKLRIGLHEDRESGRMSSVPSSRGEGEPQFAVLVVDDNFDVRSAIERVLDAYDFNVCVASGGDEALKILGAYSFDVVLSDHRMPGNGSSLLHHVKEDFKPTSFIMMTGYECAQAARAAFENGAFHFLEKPFRSNDELVLICTRAAQFARAKAKRK